MSETFFSVVVLPYKAMCAWYSPSALIQTATAQERPLPLSSQREVKKLARYSGFLYSFSFVEKPERLKSLLMEKGGQRFKENAGHG